MNLKIFPLGRPEQERVSDVLEPARSNALRSALGETGTTCHGRPAASPAPLALLLGRAPAEALAVTATRRTAASFHPCPFPAACGQEAA